MYDAQYWSDETLEAVVDAVAQHTRSGHACTVREVCDHVEVGQTTVYAVLNHLEESGVLDKVSVMRSNPGQGGSAGAKFALSWRAIGQLGALRKSRIESESTLGLYIGRKLIADALGQLK